MAAFCSLTPPLAPSLPSIHPLPLAIAGTSQLDEQSGSGYLPGSVIDCSAAERVSLYLCRVYCFFHLRRN